MDSGQKKFQDFIVERVHEEHRDAAKEMLQENFSKQAEGTFTHEDMAETQEALMGMLKPEAVDEFKAAMTHFASQME